MEKANKKQQKIMQELDYKIDEYYKTHDDESDDLYRMQAHYHKKIKKSGKSEVRSLLCKVSVIFTTILNYSAGR